MNCLTIDQLMNVWTISVITTIWIGHRAFSVILRKILDFYD